MLPLLYLHVLRPVFRSGGLLEPGNSRLKLLWRQSSRIGLGRINIDRDTPSRLPVSRRHQRDTRLTRHAGRGVIDEILAGARPPARYIANRFMQKRDERRMTRKVVPAVVEIRRHH